MLNVVLLILATFGQDVPRPVPKPAIRLPELSVPTPTPVSPDAVQVLKAGELFIVDSDQECFIRQAPPGVLKIKPMVGPRSFYAVFAGGTGEPEERDYAGKFLYVLTAAKTARCELFVIPKGVDADNKILQRTIDSQTGPRPPPDPDPPKPDDGPKADPIWPSVAAMFGADQSDQKAAMAKKLASVYRNAVTAGPGFVPTVDDTRLTTFRELSDAMAGAAAASGVPLPNLQPIREIFMRELLAKVGQGDDTALTASTRANARKQFARFAAILEALGQ